MLTSTKISVIIVIETNQTKKGQVITMTVSEFNFDDFETDYTNKEYDCKVTMDSKTEYANITDCVLEKGDEMAKNSSCTSNIVAYYQDRAFAIRKFIANEFDQKEYETMMNLFDSFRHPSDDNKPIVSAIGYYTEWIRL